MRDNVDWDVITKEDKEDDNINVDNKDDDNKDDGDKNDNDKDDNDCSSINNQGR